jgi:hypothetical protein
MCVKYLSFLITTNSKFWQFSNLDKLPTPVIFKNLNQITIGSNQLKNLKEPPSFIKGIGKNIVVF